MGKVHYGDHAAELDDTAAAGALDDAAVMHRDGGVDQVAAKGPKASEDAIFILELELSQFGGHPCS